MRKSSQIKAKLCLPPSTKDGDQVKDKSRELLKAASSSCLPPPVVSSCPVCLAIAIARLTWLALSAKHLLILLHEETACCLPASLVAWRMLQLDKQKLLC